MGVRKLIEAPVADDAIRPSVAPRSGVSLTASVEPSSHDGAEKRIAGTTRLRLHDGRHLATAWRKSSLCRRTALWVPLRFPHRVGNERIAFHHR
jgi:hypothetical protein